MKKVIQHKEDQQNLGDEWTVNERGQQTKNAMMALFKAEKSRRFESELDSVDWLESDDDVNQNDLSQKDLNSLFYEMSTEVNVWK